MISLYRIKKLLGCNVKCHRTKTVVWSVQSGPLRKPSHLNENVESVLCCLSGAGPWVEGSIVFPDSPAWGQERPWEEGGLGGRGVSAPPSPLAHSGACSRMTSGGISASGEQALSGSVAPRAHQDGH